MSPDESSSSSRQWIQVALDVPLEGLFEYEVQGPCRIGLRVIVPFGRRQLIGIVLSVQREPSLPAEQIKSVIGVLDDLPALPDSWIKLALFASTYYHRPAGEVMLPALPVPLRSVSAYNGKRKDGGPVSRLRKRLDNAAAKSAKLAAKAQASVVTPMVPAASVAQVAPVAPLAASDSPARVTADSSAADAVAPRRLTDDQLAVLREIEQSSGFKAFLLFGVTGAGKTEVYLQAAMRVLSRGGTVLFLVPEINLTPQFAAALGERLCDVVAPHEVVVMHSGLTDGQRTAGWVATLDARARVVLGTRLAVFAPLSKIDLIVVDEEHDTSYKQQDGLRYSARDLAVWRARQHDAPIILGSATPSLESWWHARRSNYQCLRLSSRALTVPLPQVRLVDTRRLKLEQGVSPQMVKAMQETLDSGQQVLVYLNRRGYAPVLHCGSCGWVSNCDHCSVFTVLHKAPGKMRLHCHHCGVQRAVPRACPECGDQDLQPMGRGTQRLEEHLQALFPERRIVRIDADSTRLKGSAQKLFDHVHTGDVDILVGTQMVSKGHDFVNLGLVVVLNPDAALFSQDFRAPERLFAQLVQVAGRAGRHTGHGLVLVQTDYPEQPVYRALLQHDYEGFANAQLALREQAGLPPFSYQALLTAQAKELPVAMAFLEEARASAQAWLQEQGLEGAVMLYDAVALRVVRVAGQCRAQLLMESESRALLHRMLDCWLPMLGSRHGAGALRWQIEVDPLEI